MAFLTTAKDLLSKHEYEIMKTLDVSEPVARHLIQLTSELCCPAPQQASALLAAKMRDLAPFVTSLDVLDAALRGGLPTDNITEVVGPPGVGKTQFCHTMAVAALTQASPPALRPQGSVIYIDTETTFSATRLVQIAAARFPSAYSTPAQREALASRVAVLPVNTAAELAQRVDSLEEFIIQQQAQLVILDSVASVARLDFDTNTVAARQELLVRLASVLKAAAERLRVPVLVSNQVTSTTRHTAVALPQGVAAAGGSPEGGSFMTPALGVLWAHSVNTRLALDFPPEAAGENRRMTLAKSSIAPVLSFSYVIEAGGVRLSHEVTQVEGNYWNETLTRRSEAAPGMGAGW